MAEGQILASIWASWPAPEVIRRQESPRAFAARSTRRTMPSSNRTGSEREMRSALARTPSVFSRSLRYSSRAASSARSSPSSGFRTSTVNTARSGITFTALGEKPMVPTVATVLLPGRRHRSRRNRFTFAAASPASARMLTGVVPAWFCLPSIVTRYQAIPCRSSTAPMAMPSASRMGPCSMCSST